METEFADPSLEREFKGHKDTVTALSFHPSSNQLISSSLDRSIMMWNFSKSLRCYKFQGHTDAVMDATFSRSGHLIASVSRGGIVRLWVPTLRGESGEFRAHSKTIRSVDFSPLGQTLLTASDDKTLKLWTVQRRKFIRSYVQHTNWVRCARFSPDGTLIASCSDDKTIKLWSVEGGSCIHSYQELKGYGTHLAWHPSGFYLAVGLSNGVVKLYDVRNHLLMQHYRAHQGAISQIAFHPTGNYLLTSSQDKKMKILDLIEGHPVYTIIGHDGPITAVTFSADGEYFASGGADRRVMIWKTNFVDKENFPEENSVLNATTMADKNNTENCNDFRIVDARKSVIFQSNPGTEDSVMKEDTFYKFIHPHNPVNLSSGHFSSENQYNSSIKKNGYNSIQSQITLPIFTDDNEPYHDIHHPRMNLYWNTNNYLPNTSKNMEYSTYENVRNKYEYNQIIPNKTYYFGNENPTANFVSNSTLNEKNIGPVVKTMICHLEMIHSTLLIMEQRITGLENMYFYK